MALKPDRQILAYDISHYMFSVATRGGVAVSASGTGGWVTGPGMDSSDNRVEYAATASGRLPVGLLLNDVVNIDQSRQQLNQYKQESQVGDKVTLMTKGWAVTNSIAAGEASGIAVPAPVYVGLNGNLYTTAGFNTASGYPLVGKVLTNVDAEGYAKVQIDL